MVDRHPKFHQLQPRPAGSREVEAGFGPTGKATETRIASKKMGNFFKSVALYFSLGQILMSKRLFNWLTSRGAGVLLHPTSLPGPAGIGTLGQEARRYVDFLADTGMRCWQICPLGPTGFGNSPYQCFSAFAGNPYLIDVTGFVAAGLLTESVPMPL